MTGNPRTDIFRVILDTNLPHDLVLPIPVPPFTSGKPFPDFLNKFGGSVWDSAYSFEMLGYMLAKGVTQYRIYDSKWIYHNGKVALQSTWAVTSDPISAADLALIILGAALVIAAAILVVFYAIDPGLGIYVTVIVGGLLILAATIDIIGGSPGNIIATILLIVGAAVGAMIVVPALQDVFRGKRKTRQRAYTPRRRVATRRR